MAFVFKDDKKLGKEIPFSELGPGQYLPQDLPRNLKPAKVPFNSITFRETSLKKNNNSPGPGSYEYDEKYDNFAKLINKTKKSLTNFATFEVNGLDDLDPFQIVINRETQKDPAFLTKEKRFKEVIKSNDNPGPGFYSSHDPNFIVKNSIRNNKDKAKNKFMEKSKLTLMRYDNSSGSPSRIISIPSKNISYGYDVLPNGEAFLKDDPEKNYKYKGELGDTVGPGSYETLPAKRWNKNMVTWEKLSRTSAEIKSNITNLHSSYSQQENKDTKNIADNINKLNTINNGNNFYSSFIKDKNSTQQDNFISTKNEIMMAKEKQREIKDKIFKQIKEKRQKLLEIKNINTGTDDDLISKHVMHQDPGPGYYNIETASTCFKSRPMPEKYQTFGSNSLRFFDHGANELGPGSYFKNDQRLEKIKLKKFLDEKVNYSQSLALQKEEIKKERLFDNDSKLGINGLINRSKILIDGNIPGPGSYETICDNFNSHKKGSSNFGQFGSIEKRFVDNVLTEPTPGPGSYISINFPRNNYTSSNSSTIGGGGGSLLSGTGNIYKLIRKQKKRKSDDERENSMSPMSPNLSIELKKSNDKIKQRKKEKEIPDVGTYNSDIIFSMGYKNMKKINKYNSDKAPFCSMEKRFKNNEIKTAAIHLAPGHYYKEKSMLVNNTSSISPPFNTSVDRLNENKLNKNINKNGPGMYNLNSYFDWNKKSYNIQFI